MSHELTIPQRDAERESIVRHMFALLALTDVPVETDGLPDGPYPTIRLTRADGDSVMVCDEGDDAPYLVVFTVDNRLEEGSPAHVEAWLRGWATRNADVIVYVRTYGDPQTDPNSTQDIWCESCGDTLRADNGGALQDWELVHVIQYQPAAGARCECCDGLL